MEKLFVSYELALKLKELGYNEVCFGCTTGGNAVFKSNHSYYKHTAILYQQVIDWFREKHGMHLDVTFREVNGNKIEGINSVYFDIEIYKLSGGDATKIYKFSEYSDNYYESLNKAIEESLKIINI